MNKTEMQKLESAVEWAIINAATGADPDEQWASVQSLLQGMVRTRKTKFDPHKTPMEYWCAGEVLPKQLNRKPAKGSRPFHIMVVFEDRDAINTTVYALDKEQAQDEAIRQARTRKMNRERGPGEYVTLEDGSLRKTSICSIAAVARCEGMREVMQ